MVAVGLEVRVVERADGRVAKRVERRVEGREVEVGLEEEAVVMEEDEEEGREKVTLGVTEETAPFREEDLEEDLVLPNRI